MNVFRDPLDGGRDELVIVIAFYRQYKNISIKDTVNISKSNDHDCHLTTDDRAKILSMMY